MSAITLGTTVLSCLPSGTGSARLPQYLLPSSTRVDEWWRHLGGTFKLVVGGWFVIALTIGVIGWIVRGFCGIPFGQDRKEPAISEELKK